MPKDTKVPLNTSLMGRADLATIHPFGLGPCAPPSPRRCNRIGLKLPNLKMTRLPQACRPQTHWHGTCGAAECRNTVLKFVLSSICYEDQLTLRHRFLMNCFMPGLKSLPECRESMRCVIEKDL